MERDERIDAAVADVYQARDDREAAQQRMADADRRAGSAVVRVMAEGLTIARVADLCELTAREVAKLKARAIVAETGRLGAEHGGPIETRADQSSV